MSSILKALKKLEDEKTARKPDSLNIDAEILRGDSSPRISLPVICLVAALVFVCGGGAMYLYLKPDAGTQVTASGPLSGGRSSSPAPSAAPPGAREHMKAVRTDSPTLSTGIETPRTQRDPGHASPSPAASPRPLEKPRTVQPVKPTGTKRPVEAPASQAMTPAGQPEAPTLKVNGIAFQDGGGESVAVVNGISVSNGSVIDGARVEEIQKDMVRFSYGGEKIEVLLGRSNR